MLVSATNVSAGKGTNGFLFGYWDNQDKNNIAQLQSAKISGQISKKNDLALVPLAKASSAVDPNAKEEEISQSMIGPQSMVLAAGGSGNPMRDPEQDGGVKMYTVAQGDTISSIAARNKVSVNTIMWANDIDNVDSIMPGDVIFILPVSGIQYKVKKGDDINSIASKYKSDKEKIISFNDLPANGDLEEGQQIVIPDGQMESSQNQVKPASQDTGIARRQYANSSGGTPEVSSGWKTLSDGGGAGHKFPYGYCTWYVAQKRHVPWGGNAGTWLYHAKAAGYKTGKAPQAGAIIVTTENRYYGHVALVEKVSGDTITVSEMNYAGFAKVSRRTISVSSRAIKGYIYN